MKKKGPRVGERVTPNGMSQTEQPKGPILARTTYYHKAQEVKMPAREDGYQDEADRVLEETKGDRDVVDEAAEARVLGAAREMAGVEVPRNQEGKVIAGDAEVPGRYPTQMDDPAAIEGPGVEARVARVGRDHAAGRLQRGLPMEADPRAPESGLRASSIAAIAYDAVQRYKEHLGQGYVWWVNLDARIRVEITDGVAKMMRGEMVGAAAMHANWAKNLKAHGVTEEADPRVGQGWCDIDPIERRKGIIFAKVVTALLQPV